MLKKRWHVKFGLHIYEHMYKLNTHTLVHEMHAIIVMI